MVFVPVLHVSFMYCFVEDSTDSEPFPEEPISTYELATGLGYGESKLVAESVLRYISASTNMPITIARVGQLSGGLSGAWNIREWFPAMVQNSRATGCLPQSKEVSP